MKRGEERREERKKQKEGRNGDFRKEGYDERVQRTELRKKLTLYKWRILISVISLIVMGFGDVRNCGPNALIFR